MKLYLATSLIGISAMAFIAAQQPPDDVPAAALAIAGASPTAMARQAEAPWLFRTMPAACDVETLTTLPSGGLAQARSL